jgi:hypothetical protein
MDHRESVMRTYRSGLTAALLCAVTALPLTAQQTPNNPRTSSPVLDAVLTSLEWRSIGPANMSGRVTDVEGIPSPSRTFYVATAAGGVWKTTNNGVTLRPLFQSERVASLGDMAIAPSDTNQVWLGTGEEDARNSISPGGGIYKSADGGMTWNLMGLEKTEHIGRIVVHPTNPDVVWVAAMGATWRTNPERGLYKTVDGGRSWQLKKFINDTTGFIDVVIHPRNPDVLFAASWQRIRTPFSLYSGGRGSALWRTTDGGETWTEVTGGGFPQTMKGRIGLDISLSHPDIMYALVEAEAPDGHDPEDRMRGCRASKAGGCGLYRSEDGGRSWNWMAPQNVRPFYYSEVRIDPVDPDRVFWSSTPVNFSTDAGRTVRTATLGLHVDHHAMWIDPLDPQRMVAGNDGGIGVSFDRGGNWWFPNTYAIGQFYAVSFDMAVPYSVCGGLQDNGTWCGPSRKAGQITNADWFNVGGGDGFVTAQDPRDPCRVYYESQGGAMNSRNICTGEMYGVQRPNMQQRYRMWEDSIAVVQPDPDVVPDTESQRRLARFRANQVRDSVEDQFRYNWNTPFFLSPHNPDVFYAGANRVLKSVSRGQNLQPISPDLSKRDSIKIRIATRITGGITADVTGAEMFGTIVSLAESPVRQGLLAAGTDDGNVWISRDDGGNWTDLTPKFRRLVPDTSYVSRIEFSPHDASRFYVTFDDHRRGNFQPYVLVTRDGGNTFRSIASNLPTGGPDFVHVVREDPVNPNLLYVGTDVGLYLSLDQGQNWHRWTNGFPTTPVHDLKIHPRDRELIVGTHGRSIWVVDVAPLQQLTQRLLAGTDPVLFEGSPGLQFPTPSSGGGSTGHSFWRGDNRASNATVHYWLPSQVNGEVQLTVTDAGGNVIQTLSGPGGAGLHTVSWNMRTIPAPRPAAELTPAQRRDSVVTMRRADVVGDSLIGAGMDSTVVRQVARLLKGESPQGGLAGLAAAFGGGGGAGAASSLGQQRGFADRPGEGGVVSAGGGGGGGGAGAMNQVVQAFAAAGVRPLPGAQIGGFGAGGAAGRGAAGAGPLAEAGSYTVTATLGDVTLTSRLQVVTGAR